jgi:hypothetical protein
VIERRENARDGVGIAEVVDMVAARPICVVVIASAESRVIGSRRQV